MAKHKPVIEIDSYGIYSTWDADDKALPKIKQFTTEVPARVDIEFGFIVSIRKAKNRKLRYCVYHPDIPDKKGNVMPPFEGEEYVRTNDWQFYLGDTLWEPLDTMLGPWRMTMELDGELIAEKTFMVEDDLEPYEGAQFWAVNRPKLRR